MSIRPEFRYHELNEQGIAACTTIREAFSALLTTIDDTVPVGRPKSVATTKLQEACNWAVRGVAEQPANQKGEAPAE